MWTMAPGIVSAPYLEKPNVIDRKRPGNPITNWYETKDGRWIYLVLLQGDRFWGELCAIIGRDDLTDDSRYKDAAVRFENRAECVKELDETFSTRTLEEWKEALQALSGVWAPAINFKEVHEHPQVEPNGFLPKVTGHDGLEFRLVSPAMQFDEVPTVPAGPAPECGQDTEAILMDVGLDWDEITSLRQRGGLG